MQNTEGGRKLNQAMVSTGRAVATTGRAVGEFIFFVLSHILQFAPFLENSFPLRPFIFVDWFHKFLIVRRKESLSLFNIHQDLIQIKILEDDLKRRSRVLNFLPKEFCNKYYRIQPHKLYIKCFLCNGGRGGGGL